MNENYSDSEWKYKKRVLKEVIAQVLKDFPVVVLSGARQVGKSTFLQEEFPEFKYLSMDDFSVLEQAKIDHISLWKDVDKVIIDEAQKVPEIFSAVKLTVDRTRRKKKFILSGSSDLLLMKNITESLAGRAIYLEMYPLTIGEIIENFTNFLNFKTLFEENLELNQLKQPLFIPKPIEYYLIKGFMPPLLYVESLQSAILWWKSYVKTYLERDLRDFARIESLIDFRKVMSSLAFRCANQINQTEIARDTGISQPTVYRYLNLLEITSIIRRIFPYFPAKAKRIIKTPKVFFIDPALAVYLTGYSEEKMLQKAREKGAFFENLVFLHLKVNCAISLPKAELYFYRDTTGLEVDFVVEKGTKIVAFEAKLTNSPSLRDVKNLLKFLEKFPETLRSVVIHAGEEIKWLHSKILALPWWYL
ncbi:ATP-binding protein [Thermodesulfobacterium hydrogeniphilum]|uniref:ATP-binding protein n=1 Tax=Thermodesulfobacterium hydrogeniphilum TaxID=161156 RepID=UPI00057071A2|nr:ATP-binding protein [Thermodesulfobacterium hydrogeniphilum]